MGSCVTDIAFYLAVTAQRQLTDPIPLKWKQTAPVWVEQWPLTLEKLSHLQTLVEEQLKLGHLEESFSPWNTPVFVIKKKSGKW